MRGAFGTLGRYIGGRFVLAMVGTLAVCASLIVMIDLVELLRMTGRSGSIPIGSVALIVGLRLSSYIEILLPFCVLVGSGVALIQLNRRSELAVMRAAGMSAWQFVGPGILVAILLGTLATIAFNPLAALTRAEADRLLAELYGREASVLGGGASGAWLRQQSVDGSSVLSASAASSDGLTVYNPTLLQFDAEGRFVERVEGVRALLRDGYWQFEQAKVARPGREPEQFDTFAVSTYLTPDRIGDALGSAISLSFWQLPGVIRETERAGLSPARFEVQYDLHLSRPMLLAVMVLLAASVSLRSFRSGSLQTMVPMGAIGGLGFLLFSEVSRQVGVAGLTPSIMAVWVPVLVALCGSLTVLLHQEDG
jgi:lipopolysaccharide export system permease protein